MSAAREETFGEAVAKPLIGLVEAVRDFEFALADLSGIDGYEDGLKMVIGVLDETKRATDLLAEAYPFIPKGELRKRAREFLVHSDRLDESEVDS